MRQVTPISMPDVTPAIVSEYRPRFMEIDPRTLFVDDRYQRNLSERSIKLLRRIVSDWDWRSFKPPIVTEVEGAFHVIDGQHTAIAAASHPSPRTIPVMVVDAAKQEDRAQAFARHNRDRIAVTPLQLHHALVEAGDESALTIRKLAAATGVRVLRFPPGDGRYSVGDTLSVSALSALINRRHYAGAKKVLDVCVAAKMSPISSSAIRAVESLLNEDEYRGAFDPPDLVTAIISAGPEALPEAEKFAAIHRTRLWQGLAAVWFKKLPRRCHGSRGSM